MGLPFTFFGVENNHKDANYLKNNCGETVLSLFSVEFIEKRRGKHEGLIILGYFMADLNPWSVANSNICKLYGHLKLPYEAK